MSCARLAVLVLSAGLSGCICWPPPGGGGYLGYSPFNQPAAAPCGCGNPPLAAEGPVLDPGAVPGNGLMPQPGMPPLVSPPRLRPQPLAQPIPAPP